MAKEVGSQEACAIRRCSRPKGAISKALRRRTATAQDSSCNIDIEPQLNHNGEQCCEWPYRTVLDLLLQKHLIICLGTRITNGLLELAVGQSGGNPEAADNVGRCSL